MSQALSQARRKPCRKPSQRTRVDLSGRREVSCRIPHTPGACDRPCRPSRSATCPLEGAERLVNMSGGNLCMGNLTAEFQATGAERPISRQVICGAQALPHWPTLATAPL